MDLRELEAVIAIHEKGSFSGAAMALYISQPALTRRVALLERELKVKLFVRSAKGVYLTEAGKALLEPAQRALRETSEIRHALANLHERAHGTLLITSAPSVSLTRIGRLVAEFHDRFPDADVKISRSGSATAALLSVEAGTHDLAVTDRPNHSGDLISGPVWVEDCLAVFSSPDKRRGAAHTIPFVTRELLRGRPMVSLAEDSDAGIQTRALWQMVGTEPPSTIEADHPELLVTIAANGQGVAVVPRSVAMQAYDGGAQIAQPPRTISSSVHLACRKGQASPTIEQFLRIATSRRRAEALAG